MADHAPPPIPRPVVVHRKALYEVVGRHEVMGVKPGGIVELSEDHASSLIAAGHIVAAQHKRASDARKEKE